MSPGGWRPPGIERTCLGADDYYGSSLYHQAKRNTAVATLLSQPLLRLWGWLDWFAALLFWPTFVGAAVAMDSEQQSGVSAFVICFFLGLVGRLFYSRSYYKRRYPLKSLDSVDVEARVVIEPDRFCWETLRSSVRISWAAFSRVRMAGGYVLVETAPGQAYFVPRRAFSDDGQMREFAALAESYHRAALVAAHSNIAEQLPPQAQS